jgi:hypothetical protein
MFGPRDFAFTYARVRVVLLDTNGAEHGFGRGIPDLAFLRAALEDRAAYDRAIVFAHVDPVNGDFDPALRAPYVALLREFGVADSFYGHGHPPGPGFDLEGTRLHVVGAVDHHTLFVVALHGDGRLEVERVSF